MALTAVIPLTVFAVWFSFFRISAKDLPQKNPTEYTFDIPIADLSSRLQEAFRSGYNGMQPVFRHDENPFAGSIFEAEANRQDVFLHNYHMPIGPSRVYHRWGDPLPFLASFQVHVVRVNERQTKIQIIPWFPQVIAGKTIGIHGGWANRYADVEATTIEEYEILLWIGRKLGVEGMPAISLPE